MRTSWQSSGMTKLDEFLLLLLKGPEEEADEQVVGRDFQPLVLEKLLCVLLKPASEIVEGVGGASHSLCALCDASCDRLSH
jgi:hypothetical protein